MRSSRFFLVLYGLSGAAALVYEVVWLRLLTLSMGHTSGAVGTVLAAFMGGLAIGAWRAGRRVDSLTAAQALRAYAALELTVAVGALLLPPALSAIRPLLAWAYADGNGGALFDAIRLASSILLIALPAAAMGASFPIGVRCAGDSAGPLYAANTLGAAIGAALTGFVLLPAFGVLGTTLAGVGANVVAATGALLLAARTPHPSDTSHGSHPRTSTSRTPHLSGPSHLSHPSHPSHPHPSHLSHPSHPSHPSPASPSLFLPSALLAVSGFVALVYEVTWTRILAMILGPTTYAFSAMLVAFITGLAIGSAAAATLVSRTRRPGVWLGIAMIGTAGAALIACAQVDRLPLMIAAAAGHSDATFSSVFAMQVTLAIAMQLPMTTALGATFPLALALIGGPHDQSPRDTAVVYAANTAGAITGALAGSLILIPRLGLQHAVQAMSGAAIAAGLVAVWRTHQSMTPPGQPAGLWRPLLRLRGVATCAGLAAAAFALFMPTWNHERLANGAYRFAPALAAGDIETGLEAGRLSYYREGAAGTVSVKQLLGVTSLAIDGKVDASNGSDMLTQALLAHLPLLLHDDPHSVYVIGLGSGVTLGAALRHPIARATVSEISPEVVAASDAFAAENHQALRDRRTRLIVGDGRAHLLLSAERYDVIISEPSNPWMAGVSTLFTREFFTAARRHLKPGGILCQWAHTYNIGDADLRSIVATFLSAFPDGSAWLVGEGDLLLIGGNGPIRALDDDLTRAWRRPGVAADLAAVGVRDPFSVLTLFIGSGRDLQQYAGAAATQSDDALALEFSAPRAIYGRFEQDNVQRLRQLAAHAQLPLSVQRARQSATAAQWRQHAQMELAADSPDLAYQDFLQALSTAPDDADALDGLARAAAASGRLAAAETYLRGRAATAGTAPVLTELAAILAAQGRPGDAAVIAQRAAALDPSNRKALEQLIGALADSGNDAALEQLERLLDQSSPNSSLALRAAMRLAYLRGDYGHAARAAERLAALSPARDADRARTLNLMGSAYAAAGDPDRGRQALEASLAIAPRDAATLVNLASLELAGRNAPAAAEHFSQALFLYPTLTPALDGLAKALEQQGNTRRAATIRALIPDP